MEDRAELGMVGAVFVGMGLGLLSFVSLISLFRFASEGEVDMLFGQTCGALVGALVMVLLVTFGAHTALFVLRRSESPRALRAAYFMILFPVLLISFLVATLDTRMVPSVTFGLPLFLTGTFAYPYAAFVIHTEVRALSRQGLVRVTCQACGLVLDVWAEGLAHMPCPRCGQPLVSPPAEKEEVPLEVSPLP